MNERRASRVAPGNLRSTVLQPELTQWVTPAIKWMKPVLTAPVRCLIGGLLLAGCASTQSGMDASRPTSADYAPLPLGGSWTYQVEYPGQKGEMTIELTGEDQGYVVDNKNGAFRHTPEGLRDRQRYLIKHPLVAGTKWKSVVGPSAVEHLELTSVGEPCESLAGKFEDCVVVSGRIRRDKTMELRIEWTWAKGVGLVKLQTEADVAGKAAMPQVTQSLKSYSLEPRPSAAPSPTVPSPTKEPGKTGDDDGPPTWTSE